MQLVQDHIDKGKAVPDFEELLKSRNDLFKALGVKDPPSLSRQDLELFIQEIYHSFKTGSLDESPGPYDNVYSKYPDSTVDISFANEHTSEQAAQSQRPQLMGILREILGREDGSLFNHNKQLASVISPTENDAFVKQIKRYKQNPENKKIPVIISEVASRVSISVEHWHSTNNQAANKLANNNSDEARMSDAFFAALSRFTNEPEKNWTIELFSEFVLDEFKKRKIDINNPHRNQVD